MAARHWVMVNISSRGIINFSGIIIKDDGLLLMESEIRLSMSEFGGNAETSVNNIGRKAR